jgi:tetratricopeptide (TPR) repeat protein/tRNA A-37 threonylcarbamoyl transferase component Bud32
LAPQDDLKRALTAALADRYEILDEIGRGGMATVYLALDLRHGSRVAIKVLHPELVASMGGPRFTREIQITARLQHPHILPVLDSGEAAGTSYFVMPFVEGESLAQRLKRETRLSVTEAVRLAAEVADALAHAHQAGIIHRDIKPGNILLSHGHAIVADFGIARALDLSAAERLTDSGLAVGTVTYMSPEQAGADEVDGRSDIYSLGCVLYEALSGTPPFTGPSAQAIMARSAIDPVPSLYTLRQSVPPALESAITRALAKVPQDRFDTAAEFRDEIQRAATTPSRADLAATVPVPAARRRRPWWVLVAGAVALGVAVLVWVKATAHPPLDPNRVMVFPFVLPSDWAGPSTSGEDVATVIGSAMDGAGSLRWVDGWQHLSPAERENIRLLSSSKAVAIARAERSAYLITGRLVGQGDSVDIYLELYDVDGDSVLSRPQGRTAPAGASWRGAMRAVTEILPVLIPTKVPDVESAWANRPPQAVAHFLEGEAAFRRVRLPEALAAFRAAVAADSTFGLAAMRGAQVATWNHESGKARELVEVALRQDLKPRDRRFARGFLDYVDGRADSAAANFRAALAIDSSMVVAWLQLGEVYMHRLPAAGRTDALAEDAFEQARALDSTAAALQFHLVELRARRGDQAGAGVMARQFLRTAADTQLAHEVELVAACGPKGFAGVNLREAAVQRPLALLLSAKSLGASELTAHCAMSADSVLLLVDTSATSAANGRRYYAFIGLVQGLLSRDRPEEATLAIEAYYQRWGRGRAYYELSSPVFPALTDSAQSAFRQDSTNLGPSYGGIEYSDMIWGLAVWAARDGRPELARQLGDMLNGRAAESGLRLDSILAQSAAAHAALAAGDTTAAAAQFNALLNRPAPIEDLAWDLGASLGFDRLLLGRLLIQQQDYAKAIGVLDVLDSPMPAVFPLYRRASLTARIEAADALNRTALGDSLRARLATLSDK